MQHSLAWRAYDQIKITSKPMMVTSAQGAYLTLSDGRRIIDGISSWWTVCHGHAHPYIVDKVKQQLEQVPHVMFAGLAHQSAYELSNKLINILPKGLKPFV